MNLDSFVETKALLESLCQRQKGGHWILSHECRRGSLSIQYHVDFEEGPLELKVVDIKGWRHLLLNILCLNVHMYPQLHYCPIE